VTEVRPSIGIPDAKHRLFELCGEVVRTGQPVWLSRRGLPVAELRPLACAGPLSAAPVPPVPGTQPGILDLWQECRRVYGPLDPDLDPPIRR
jgi:prevent-host-death family protein